MPPTQPGTPPDFRPPHRAHAATANDTNPPSFYGICSAGDFRSQQMRDTQEEAKQDVAGHLHDVQARPHRAFVNMIRDAPYGYVGFCGAGDFSPRIRRATRAQAEADVVEHLDAMGAQSARADGPSSGGQPDARPEEGS